jgi:hypothetical protein
VLEMRRAQLSFGGTSPENLARYGNAREITCAACFKAAFHVFLVLGIVHVRHIEKLTAICDRDPCVPHSRVVFPLLRVVRFQCQCRALGGGGPSRLALRSHLIASRIGPASNMGCYAAPSSLAGLTRVEAGLASRHGPDLVALGRRGRGTPRPSASWGSPSKSWRGPASTFAGTRFSAFRSSRRTVCSSAAPSVHQPRLSARPLSAVPVHDVMVDRPQELAEPSSPPLSGARSVSARSKKRDTEISPSETGH